MREGGRGREGRERGGDGKGGVNPQGFAEMTPLLRLWNAEVHLNQNYYLATDAIFWDDSGRDTFCQKCGGCSINNITYASRNF